MHNSKSSKHFFSKSDFDAVKSSQASLDDIFAVVADMIRFNTLAAVAHAKSGHLGASLSAAEVFAVLYHHTMKFDAKEPAKAGRDTFILSKGHASAGIYAALASAGFFSEERLAAFRSFGGPQGHVDISVPGIDGNTGSLGMGISKGKGYALSYKLDGLNAMSYVMVGDGELQEGQNWEALQSAAHMKLDNLCLIVDKNMVQTDRELSKILDLISIEKKLEAFGWEVRTVDGNDAGKVAEAFGLLRAENGKPKALVANTLKGKGISFMEHPVAIAKDGIYSWHGAVTKKDDYDRAYAELSERIRRKLKIIGADADMPESYFPDALAPSFRGASLKPAFSEALVKLGERREDLVVLDGDLADDCGLTMFEKRFPKRFIEVGIAEGDMVSTAGGLALAGKLPVVNTYTAFLSSRANEHIFNNCSEKTKIIYVGHLAGILPAKPGKSHQGIRDASLLRAIPNITICHPCNRQELLQMIEFLVEKAAGPSYLRLEHSQPRSDVQLPAGYRLEAGRGTVLADGKDVAIVSAGPLMLSEAMAARETLHEEGIETRVLNLPWLNKIDANWLLGSLSGISEVFVLENHAPVGGQADEILEIALQEPGLHVHRIGMAGFGQSGEGEDILRYYGMDFQSIAAKIRNTVRDC
jgi:transketolase